MSLAGYVPNAIYFSSLHLNPVLVQVGPFALRWYSLAYIAGILLGWLYLVRLLDENAAPMTREHANALVTWATAGIVIGGRLAYVLFYDFATYLAHPLNVLRLWAGGMSFHGGALGVAIAIFLFARRHRLDWLRIIDYVANVRTDRTVSRPACKLRKRRTVGATDHPALGDRISRCRPSAAPPKPAL